jgi:hypothetical protein
VAENFARITVLIELSGSFDFWHGHVHAARANFQVIFVDFDKINSKKAEDQIVALNPLP